MDYVKISLYAFALSALWNSLNILVIPARVLDFAPEASKNTYLGVITAAGLLVAVLVQPLAGASSDASRLPWGKRRPYVLVGSLLVALFLMGLGLAPSLLALFLTYGLLQLSSNVAQGPYQGLIPDLVPLAKRGRASAAKLGAEVAGIVALAPLTAFFIGRYLNRGDPWWLWLALGSLAALLVVAALATLVLVRERGDASALTTPFWATLRRTFNVDWKAHPSFKWFLLSRLFILMAMGSIQAFAFYYLADVVQVTSPARVAAYLSMVAGAVVLVVAYPAGRLGDHLGRKPLLYFSGLLGCLGILGLLFARNEAQVLLSGVLLGGATCTFLVNSWALATDLVPQAREAQFLGLVNLTALGGVAARLWGPAIDFLNARQPGQGYTALFVASLAYIIIGTVLLGRIRSPASREGGVL